MAPLTDSTLLAAIREALTEWDCSGFVNWKRVAAEWLELHLEGQTQKSTAKQMYEHLEAGGEIDQVTERRPEYSETHAFHFDFRIKVDHRLIYIETVLDVTRTGPTITIVSIHDA